MLYLLQRLRATACALGRICLGRVCEVDRCLGEAMAESATGSAGRIFISYRRDEAAYSAAGCSSRLAERGDGQIFKDIDSIELGDDFVEMIHRGGRIL